jgi:hypothetical protein
MQECRHVYVQMYWLLIKKEYIIVFVYIIVTKVDNTVQITSSKRLAHVHTKPFEILANPGPNSVVINFVYSNHV